MCESGTLRCSWRKEASVWASFLAISHRFLVPLICPHCQHRMRVLAVIDQRKVIEKILLHLNLWSGLPAFLPPRGPPPAIPKHWEADDPQSRDPFPDYDNVFTD